MLVAELRTENLSSPIAIDNENPRFSWKLYGDQNNIKQFAYRVIVSSDIDNLAKDIGEMWDSGNVNSDNSTAVVYCGKKLCSKKIYWWKVTAWINGNEKAISNIDSFGMGLLLESDWACGFIGIDPQFTPISEHALDKAGAPSPFLRTTVAIHKGIKSAKAFVTSYGIYELRINGNKVGNHEMAPGWTDYNKSLQYQGYDITNMLDVGENAIGAILGDGWFTGNIAITGRRQYGDYPLGLRLHINIDYADGTNDTIVSNTEWKGAIGPIVYSDNQTGEYYDAREELTGWDMPCYNDHSWINTISVHKFSGIKYKADIGPSVQVMCQISALCMLPEKNGKYIFDMGQNMVGKIAFRLKGYSGQKVVFRYGEMLKDDGTVYFENLRTALQTDTYILKGDEKGELFETRFTYHGFRYVEVGGLHEAPAVDDIIGKVMYSNCQSTGKIETSNKMINQLFSNQLWSQRSNFFSIPTDCPQRDERMGWTGDAQVFVKSACYNMQCAGFFEKYTEDCLEAQRPNGAITDVVPHVKWSNGSDLVGYGNAAWGEVIFIIPWTLYQMYGDIKILDDAYVGMCRYLKYLEGSTTDLLRPDLGYGDWLNINEDTPKDVIGTAYFAYAAKITADIAEVLGKKQHAKQYNKLFRDIKTAFNKAYVNKAGVIKGDTQCCYILALKMQLLPKSKQLAAINHLVRIIEQKNWHLSTGFVGVSYLLPVLSDYGYNDVAYRLLLNETYPSWGYSIKNGATTMWERWNSYTKEDGFGDIGMNSFNHYALGSVAEWMYSYMGGIKPLKPSFKKMILKPYVDERLDFADIEYDCQYGVIHSHWKKDGCYICYDFSVPANTTATICILNSPMGEVEGNATLAETKDGYSIFEVDSGNYSFKSKVLD